MRTAHAAGPRFGATLTEVLMSLLIMSIGVVSVVSLFPLSVLRALQANQLTNSKFAEQNATEIVTAYPGILYGNAPQWTPGIDLYTPDVDIVIPPTHIGSHTPAAAKRYLCRDATGATPPLDSGPVEPDWAHPVLLPTDYDGDGLMNDYGVYDYAGEIIWQVDTRARVIDPFGAIFIEGSIAGTYSPEFGNVAFTAPGDAIVRVNPFSAIPLAVDQLIPTDALFALPDTWVVDLEAIPEALIAPDSAGPTQGEVTLPAGSEIPYGGIMRITLVNLNGSQVVSRPIDVAATLGAPPLTVIFNWPNLPASFDQDASGAIDINDIGSVRIEHFERRYTWLYTVSAAEANEQSRVTCVVFFNRGFSLDDEFLYDANFGNLAVADIDGSGNPDGDVDEDGTVDYAGPNLVRIWHGTDPEPAFKAGGFIFDGRAGHWYQIQSIDYVDELAGTVVLSLADPVYVRTPDAAAIGTDAGRAMLMRGIIHVFDLEL